MRNEPTTDRWDAFNPWELQALDEFFRNFAPMRDYCQDIQKISREIADAMKRRNIPEYGRDAPSCR